MQICDDNDADVDDGKSSNAMWTNWIVHARWVVEIGLARTRNRYKSNCNLKFVDTYRPIIIIVTIIVVVMVERLTGAISISHINIEHTQHRDQNGIPSIMRLHQQQHHRQQQSPS